MIIVVIVNKVRLFGIIYVYICYYIVILGGYI